jgi:uncharacterized protein (TIGR00369 family)
MNASAIYQRINESFKRQGMTQNLGFEFISAEKGKVEFAMPRSEKVLQQQGVFHGGALGTLADICCGYAALTVAPEDMEVTTVEYKINFVSGAVGERVVCIGEVKKAGRTLTICTAELFDVKDGVRKTCGYMQATVINIAKKY